MIQQQRFWSGGWWRFSQYQVKNYAIGPTDDARLEWYDPWEVYRTSKIDTGTQRPYQSILKLVMSLGAFFDEKTSLWCLNMPIAARQIFPVRSLAPDAETAILDWCSRFGLLGILPHIALTIRLPLRFGPHSQRVLVVRQNMRVNGQWWRNIDRYQVEVPYEGVVVPDEAFHRDFSVRGEDAPTPGPLVGSDTVYLSAFRDENGFARSIKNRGPTALVRNIMEYAFVEMNARQIITRFFPNYKGEAQQFECPRPLTPEFWRIYSEDVGEFLDAAVAFLQAVEPISSRRASAHPYHLERFLEPAGVSLEFDPHSDIQERWVCPSLLSSFARMALQDFAAGMRILRCDCCGGPFVTSSFQARYCSQTCGWRHRKHRARDRKSNRA